jgi:[ribosomal protein S5]-alanine N-acetyltransferase
LNQDNERELAKSVLSPRVRFKTERLLLRDFAPDDWPALHEVESREDVSRYQSFEPRTPEESRAYVRAASEEATRNPRKTYDLAVMLDSEDLLVGRCGLGLEDPSLAQGMLWYTIPSIVLGPRLRH